MYSFHPALSNACSRRSFRSLKCGASRNRLPGEFNSNCTFSASCMSRSVGVRSIWPSQRNRLILMRRTKFRLVEWGRASSLGLFPVMCDNILLLAPLICLIVDSVKSHVSHPYVKIEHTAAEYRRSLRWVVMHGDAKICRSVPHLEKASAILLFMSYFWSPSAANIVPRYLKMKTFSRLPPEQFTGCLCFWVSFILISLTAESARRWVKICSR